jgi:hypothetical protein
MHTYNKEQQRQCTYNVTLRRVRELLLPWRSNKYYIFVCVCVDVRTCVRVGARASGVYMRVRACSLAYPAFHADALYCDVISYRYGSTRFFEVIS